jgi:hypothetical protein
MKKYKILALSLIAILGAASCDRVDYGDLNDAPIQTEKGDAESLLRGSMVRYFTVGGRNYVGNATNYAQYQTQITYTSESRYADTAGDWDAYYTGILPGLKFAAETTTSPKGTTENLNATAMMFSVMVWKRVTDTFGDVPYFEALKGLDNLSPKYTAQKDIYLDLIAKAKTARDLFTAAPTALKLNAQTDIVYAGDITKWRKFANSYIMALCIQMSKKYPTATEIAAVEFNAALSNVHGVIDNNTGNMIFTPDVVGGAVNPLSGLRGADYCLTQEFTDAVKGVTGALNHTSNHTPDARRTLYLSSATASGWPYGYSDTPQASKSSSRRMKATLRAASAVTYAFTAAYTYLNRAEAAALGWTSETAATMLANAINTSAAQWIPAPTAAQTTAIATYTAARVTDATPAMMKQVIGEEKWVALFPNGAEAWAEQRRTGFPALLPAPDALNDGTIPSRVRYPQTEFNVNAINYANGVATLLPATDHNYTKLWWEQ